MPHHNEPLTPAMTDEALDRARQLLRLKSILVGVIVIAVLKAAAPIVLPLVFGLFLVALFSPIQRRLQRHMCSSLATAFTMLLLIITLGSFGGILWASLMSVMERMPRYEEELLRFMRMAESYGIAIPGFGSSASEVGASQTIRLNPQTLLDIALPILGAGGLIMLTFSYLVLSLLRFDDYTRRVLEILPARENGRWLEIARQVGQDFQGYIVVLTLIGLMSGFAIGLTTWLIGLELAFVWGLLTFLLSYIPIFGAIVATILPLLFALAQFDQWEKVLLTGTALIVIRATLGIFVNPLVQGKLLKPTPLTVLLSLAFWGWLWGIPGVFIGLPLTILIIIICHQFRHTRWIAVLLADV